MPAEKHGDAGSHDVELPLLLPGGSAPPPHSLPPHPAREMAKPCPAHSCIDKQRRGGARGGEQRSKRGGRCGAAVGAFVIRRGEGTGEGARGALRARGASLFHVPPAAAWLAWTRMLAYIRAN